MDSSLTFEQLPQAVANLQNTVNEIRNLLQQRPTQQPESYITRQEAADTLHITLPTLLNWTMEGKVKGYRIGRRVLYKKNEINEAVTSINVKKKGGNAK